MMSRLKNLAGSRLCLHCLVPTAQGDYCHECGPAFRSLSSWGYFRMPDETGVVPAHERDAYGDFGGAATFRSAQRKPLVEQEPPDVPANAHDGRLSNAGDGATPRPQAAAI